MCSRSGQARTRRLVEVSCYGGSGMRVCAWCIRTPNYLPPCPVLSEWSNPRGRVREKGHNPFESASVLGRVPPGEVRRGEEGYRRKKHQKYITPTLDVSSSSPEACRH